MSITKRFRIVALAIALGFGAVEIGTGLGVAGAFGWVREAEARAGRPLTPVSVAGVGRRTVRRCAAGAYNC
ncbi:MAG: hypothetical protein AAFX81_02950 [Pseudomonadota bacterium]